MPGHSNYVYKLIQLAQLSLLLVATIGSHDGWCAGVALCPNTFDITENSKTLKALYCASSNVDLSSSNEDDTITHAIFVIHGRERNADEYLQYMESALGETKQDKAEIAIVVPHFIIDEDVTEQDSDLLYWSSLGWIRGNASQKDVNDRPFTISSFAVADLMIEAAMDLYPNLIKITIFGFSAGGQWVHRYASGSAFEGSHKIQVQYIIGSPGSYMYFSKERPTTNNLEIFSVPDDAACPGYNEYNYGLDGLNEYMAGIGASNLESNYKSRDVVILLGDEDNMIDSVLDVSCAANLQGDNRFDRGLAFWNHAIQFFGEKRERRHKLHIIPGVGHFAGDMMQSPCGLLLLFDYDPENEGCPDY